MQFWLSGEVQVDIADAYRAVRKEVEAALNEALGDRDYGPHVREWDFIAIIRELDHPDYDELKKYDRRDKSLEFRLKLNHEQFKAADELARRRMLMGALVRSAREAVGVAPSGTRLDQIERDMMGVARSKAWAAES